MIETRCETTELLVDQCGCRDHKGRPAPADPFDTPTYSPDGPGPWFTAAFNGECSGCGFDYEAGVIIRADGAGGYEAEECCGPLQ